MPYSDWSNVSTAACGCAHRQDTHYGNGISRKYNYSVIQLIFISLLNYKNLLQVIGPILVVAAALSVQSPLSRVLMGQSDISVRVLYLSYCIVHIVCICLQIARRPLESEQGDPFTLLNAYDEWIQVSEHSMVDKAVSLTRPTHSG